MNNTIISVENVVTRFAENIVHDGVGLSVSKGEIYGLLGGSGSGKSTLLKEMIMLEQPVSGEISVLGYDLVRIGQRDADALRRQWGVLFQAGALYSSLTVRDNISVTLREYSHLPEEVIQEIVQLKIAMVGLAEDTADLYPAELSGGMVKRVALARALAMDPELLFLDEPTSGLDPVGAEAFDKLIVELRDMLGLTVVMVTHDLDSIWTIVDRFAVLGEKRVVAEGTLEQVLTDKNPIITQFFGGTRGRIRRQRGK